MLMFLLFPLVLTLSVATSADPTCESSQSYLQSFDKFELTYFDGRGLAEVPRTIFATASQSYKDIRLSREAFNEKKGTGDLAMNLNRVPVLNHNGKIIGQSSAIARYLAQHFGMFGSTREESALIDSICEHVVDIKAAFRKLFPYKVELTDEKKAENFDIWFNTPSKPDLDARKNRQLQWFLEQIEELLPGDNYSIGGRPNLADAYLFNLLGEQAKELGKEGEGWFGNRKVSDSNVF
jgi:glutathione S-transferase